MAHFVITIAREKGSGGYDIAKKLSERLNVPFYDRKILRIASDVSGINEQLFGEVDERLGKHEMMRAAEKVYSGEVLPPDSDNYISQENLFQFQAKIILELAETSSCIEKQPPSIRSAASASPRPMAIEARGAPPELTSAAKADTIIITGAQTPSPVSARLPPSAMWPMYILSTILYSMLTICAATVGMASFQRSLPIGSVPRNAFF